MPNKQLDAEYYDSLYTDRDRSYDRPRTSPYYPMYRRVVALLRQEGAKDVLDVGCGSGVLAEMLIAEGLSYRGFDFSTVAVDKARKRNPGGCFYLGDATDPAAYQDAYDSVVCCEVLEHLEGDLTVIERWRPGTPVVCSVPNFDYESHVRYFRSEREVAQRYGALIDIRSIERVPSTATANVSWVNTSGGCAGRATTRPESSASSGSTDSPGMAAGTSSWAAAAEVLV